MLGGRIMENGQILVAEENPEVVWDKRNSAYMQYDTPTFVDLHAGDEVFTEAQLMQGRGKELLTSGREMGYQGRRTLTDTPRPVRENKKVTEISPQLDQKLSSSYTNKHVNIEVNVDMSNSSGVTKDFVKQTVRTAIDESYKTIIRELDGGDI